MKGDRTSMHALLAGLDPVLCDRYLAGECTPEEMQKIDDWISEDAARQSALGKLRRGLAEPIAYPALASSATVVARVMGAVAPQSHQERDAGQPVDQPDQYMERRGGSRVTLPHGVARHWNPGKSSLARAPWYALVGAVVGAFLLMLGQWSEARRVNTMSTAHGSTYTTAKGQRATITLPDGSTVILNVASRLEVPADYASGNRALRLNGEALFSIVPDARRAVTVTSGGVTTRVLGTSFLVQHYPDDTATIVAVRNGKVAVRTLVLAAMQQSEITDQGATQVHMAQPSQFTFATGMLTLDDVPLREAVVELSRWYDLDIQLGDASLATRRIGGAFAAGAQADLMTIFKESMHLRVVREGHMVILYPRAGA